MTDDRYWLPSCPECNVPDQGGAVTADSPREARAKLAGSQTTCSRCGTTYKVGDATTIRRGSRP